VDLELRFGNSPVRSPHDVLIWVEIKWTADPHEKQLATYIEDLPRSFEAASVVLLAPRLSLPYERDEVPEGVPQRSWQATARQVQAQVQDPTDAIGAFLSKELYTYMQQHSLTEPEVIRPEHLVALAYSDEAETALAAMCERASGHVQRAWGSAPDGFAEASRTRAPDYGWQYWEGWRRSDTPEGLGDLWLDWNACNEPAHLEAEGRSLFFMSGLVADEHESLAPTTQDEVRRRELLEAGVHLDGRVCRFKRISDRNERFAQTARPEEVLVGRTLDQQAESLATWIVTGFKALTMPVNQLPASTSGKLK